MFYTSDLEDRINKLETDLNQAQTTCNEKEAVARAGSSVVRIIGGEGEGTGFQMDDFIVTNFHVIEFEASPKVVYPDGKFSNAEIVMADKKSDLAFLQVDRTLDNLYHGDSDMLQQTDVIYLLGFPFGGDLNGELTIKKGIVSAKRHSSDVGVEYIQTDASLNPGMSGGPMLDHCGYVIGINTLGGAGIGMGISSKSILAVEHTLEGKNVNPLKDIQVLDIKENETPLLTVNAFYSYLKLRRLDKAFTLLGKYKENMKFENWKRGYEPNLDTTVLSSEVDKDDPSKINVFLRTTDLVAGNIVYNYFEGYWIVTDHDGTLLMDKADIKKVDDAYDSSWL